MKINVMVFETLRKDVVVEANTNEEAIEVVKKAYESGTFEMTMDDFVEDMTDYDTMPFDEGVESGEIDPGICIYL